MLKKIKIVHIITRLDKGGSAENVLVTCKNLDKEKYDIVLIYGKSQTCKLNLQFTQYRIDELVREISPIKDIIAFWKIYKIIKKEKPDIIHTHSSKAGFLGRWSAWLSGSVKKIVHTPHGHVFYGYFSKIKSLFFLFLERITAKITDKLVALTEGEKNESVKFGIGKPQKWIIIHSGVENINKHYEFKNERLLKELNISKNSIIIGTVARLEPVKGIKYFIDAIPFILNSENLQPIVFLIVGDGTERKILELKTKKLNIEDKVVFTGMRDDVVDLISLMDIYVQPSVNEGMGKTIVMACMLAKPVVATKIQGIPSIIIDNKTGLLVPAKDSLKLAQAILKLIKDKNLRYQLGQNAKMFVSETVEGFPKFSVERMIYLLEKLYNEL
ncbi:MAG: glycosyltransferase family 4 protein [Endomicrobiia bacterium]